MAMEVNLQITIGWTLKLQLVTSEEMYIHSISAQSSDSIHCTVNCIHRPRVLMLPTSECTV